MSKFKQYIQLYGLWNTLLRIFKSLLIKVFHFTWEKAYLLSRTQQDVIPLAEPNGFSVKQLEQNDLFGDRHWQEYVQRSKDFLVQCFASDYAKAYGAYVNGRLAYVTWTLYDYIEINGELIPAKGVATEWNVYCLPEFRGRGLHSYVKAWTINEMLRNNAQKCVSITLSYNRPALKTQNKFGFNIEKTFYSFRIGDKRYIKWLH